MAESSIPAKRERCTRKGRGWGHLPLRRLTQRLATLGLLVIGGCIAGAPSSPEEALGNLTLTVSLPDPVEVRLRDRRGTLPSGGDLLMDDLILHGRLEGMPSPVTAGILYLTGSEGERRTHLVLAVSEERGLRPLASLELGGAMRIEGLRFSAREVRVHTMEYAGEDLPCCPTLPAERRFAVENGELIEVQEQPPISPLSGAIESP